MVRRHATGEGEGMPLGAGDRRHLDAVVAAWICFSAARHGQKGHSVAAGATGRQGGEDGHVEEVIRALQHDRASDGQEVGPEVRHVQEDEHGPEVVQVVHQEEGAEVAGGLAAVQRGAGHQQNHAQ